MSYSLLVSFWIIQKFGFWYSASGTSLVCRYTLKKTLVPFYHAHKICYYYPIFCECTLVCLVPTAGKPSRRTSTHTHTLYMLNNTTESLNVDAFVQPAHLYVLTTPSLFRGNVCFLAWAVAPLCQTVICRCHSPSDHIYMVFRESHGEAHTQTHTHAPQQIDKHRKSLNVTPVTTHTMLS